MVNKSTYFFIFLASLFIVGLIVYSSNPFSVVGEAYTTYGLGVDDTSILWDDLSATTLRAKTIQIGVGSVFIDATGVPVGSTVGMTSSSANNIQFSGTVSTEQLSGSFVRFTIDDIQRGQACNGGRCVDAGGGYVRIGESCILQETGFYEIQPSVIDESAMVYMNGNPTPICGLSKDYTIYIGASYGSIRVSNIQFRIPFGCGIEPGLIPVMETFYPGDTISLYGATQRPIKKICRESLKTLVFENGAAEPTTAIIDRITKPSTDNVYTVPSGKQVEFFYYAKLLSSDPICDVLDLDRNDCTSKPLVKLCKGIFDEETGICVETRLEECDGTVIKKTDNPPTYICQVYLPEVGFCKDATAIAKDGKCYTEIENVVTVVDTVVNFYCPSGFDPIEGSCLKDGVSVDPFATKQEACEYLNMSLITLSNGEQICEEQVLKNVTEIIQKTIEQSKVCEIDGSTPILLEDGSYQCPNVVLTQEEVVNKITRELEFVTQDQVFVQDEQELTASSQSVATQAKDMLGISSNLKLMLFISMFGITIFSLVAMIVTRNRR